MQVVDVAGFHKVTQLSESGIDYQLTPYTKTNELVTIQSVFIKANSSKSTDVVFKTQQNGYAKTEIMNITVAANSTKVINVKQQLPEAYAMFASASVDGAVITINGITATLGE